MKNFNKTFILLLLLLSTIFTFGQKPFLDSVYVQVGDEMELNLSIYDYDDLFEHVAGLNLITRKVKCGLCRS